MYKKNFNVKGIDNNLADSFNYWFNKLYFDRLYFCNKMNLKRKCLEAVGKLWTCNAKRKKQ